MELLGDPFQSEFPELIEDSLSLPGRSTAATVVAFNRKCVSMLTIDANSALLGETFSP